ncbi:hypothetical protein JW868_02080 [Candidatus Woesearchaeota archaeon]|nr:hypothetical protein [Candidatus Woesearchaeota archaeon]
MLEKMWFDENLAKVEAAEKRDFLTEKKLIENIVAFINEKARKENEIISHITKLSTEDAVKSKNTLQKEIKDVVDFLNHLESRIGKGIRKPEFDDLLNEWKEILDLVGKIPEKASVAEFQNRSQGMFTVMFRDLQKLDAHFARRYQTIARFLALLEKDESIDFDGESKEQSTAESKDEIVNERADSSSSGKTTKKDINQEIKDFHEDSRSDTPGQQIFRKNGG